MADDNLIAVQCSQCGELKPRDGVIAEPVDSDGPTQWVCKACLKAIEEQGHAG